MHGNLARVDLRKRVSEEQFIGVLKEHQAGMSAASLCRQPGISDATHYTWRSKYGGMELSDAKKLKALDHGNRKPSKRQAEQLLDNATLKEMLRDNYNYENETARHKPTPAIDLPVLENFDSRSMSLFHCVELKHMAKRIFPATSAFNSNCDSGRYQVPMLSI